MDEGMGDQVAEPIDDSHVQSHPDDFSLKPGSSNMLQSYEMVVTPGVDDYPDNSRMELNAKDLDRIGSSEHASASPRCMDDSGIMVKELTLRNYDGDKCAVMDTSNNRDRKMHSRRNQWQSLYQIAGGSGISNRTGLKGKANVNSSTEDDGLDNLFSGLLDQNQTLANNNHHSAEGNMLSSDDKGTPSDALYSSGGIRTKILSKSGFSEFFIKNTLRGKGVIHRHQALVRPNTVSVDPEHGSSIPARLTNPVAQSSVIAQPVLPQLHRASETLGAPHLSNTASGISLREWIEAGKNKANKGQTLRIFRRVLDIVERSHSHSVPLQALRPSCLKLTGDCQVMHIRSSLHGGVVENTIDPDSYQSSHNRFEKKPMHQSKVPLDHYSSKKRKLGDSRNIVQRWPQFPSRSGSKSASQNVMMPDSDKPENHGSGVDEDRNAETEMQKSFNVSGRHVPDTPQPFQASVSSSLEEKWYTSPELLDEKGCTFASNIYSLGILLFELLGSFDSGRSHAAAMLDLRHRILPPTFLSANPREAGFCLWLLHPEPSLRPTVRDILQSEFVSGIQESSGDELLSSIDEEDADSELLSHFLLTINEQKQKDAAKLVEQLQLIEADIQEIEKRRSINSLIFSKSAQECLTVSGSTNTPRGNRNLVLTSTLSPVKDEDTRLASNMRQLESAYFSMRSKIPLLDANIVHHRDLELLRSRESWSNRVEGDDHNPADHLGDFFDGLCKYARFSKFKVRGILRNGEFSGSANVICSLNFDRDEDYLATGGVSKKIKIFEFESLLSDSVDVHYPVVEMTNGSKISCLCWNSYIRNYLVSTDYEGIVKLWDASSGQVSSQFAEHSERAWSVDFSRTDPTKIASGGDDRSVKVWSINDRSSSCTIRNNANICCVQFSADSSHLVAFSSADYKSYCYDLRNVSRPWCVLAGHDKAVSYAKFLDSTTLVSASTDNTLKIWDLSKTSSNSVSRDACILTLRGHTNEKNFVGLSVADGYIACGSETNEVFAYHKSLPMPITNHKFGSIDAITGKETEDVYGQFVSSVCWRRKSNMVVAANSSGCIKLLQMV